MPKKSVKPGPKPNAKGGSSADAKALRRTLFRDAYLTNGNNATQAAIAAGASPKSAHVTGSRWLKEAKLSQEIAKARDKVAFDSGLSTERWAKEMACLGHIDPAELYDPEGNLIPIHLLPEHVRRSIASIEAITDKDGNVTKKIKLWDKNTALTSIGKHLGAFEKDNHQKSESVKVLIQLVG